MLILVFTFDVGKYCNKKKGFSICWLLRKEWVLLVSNYSDLLVAKKIMDFLEASFSPPVWLLRKSISGKHFFLLGHKMGPEVPQPNETRGARGARWGQVQAPEKNPFSKQTQSEPRVLAHGLGLGMEKPDPLPFLLMTGSRWWLAACKPPEVAHVPSMPEIEASCQLEHYRTKSTNWPFSYLVARTCDSVKPRVQATNQLYFEKPDSSHSILILV